MNATLSQVNTRQFVGQFFTKSWEMLIMFALSRLEVTTVPFTFMIPNVGAIDFTVCRIFFWDTMIRPSIKNDIGYPTFMFLNLPLFAFFLNDA